MDPAAKDWIEGYQNQISSLIENDLPTQADKEDMWQELMSAPKHNTQKTTAVTPLTSTLWDQPAPYNGLCPGTGSSRAVTGCVATAMAQIMKFHNWPTVGCADHYYTAPTPYGVLNADFGNTVYNWTGMPNSITSANLAIETLMVHAGISVNMNYSTTSSGSYVCEAQSPINICAEYALKTYFHYKRSLKGLVRFGLYSGGVTYLDSIPQATWISTLQNELNAGRPLIYTGQGSAGGHAWVCDGWNSSTSGVKFHFNFGWSGNSNGYYTVNNVNPAALGTGGGAGNFNASQGAIVGIQPDPFPTSTGNIQMLAHLNCTTNSPMNYGSPFTVVTKVKNAGTSTWAGDLALQVFDTSNALVGTVQTLLSQTIAAGDSTAALTFNTTGLYNMIPMLYYHYQLMYRPTGTTTWSAVANNGNFINYNILDVHNDTDIVLYDSIAYTPGPIIVGHPFSVTSSLANEATTGFSGSIQATFIDVNSGTSYPIQVEPGQSFAAHTYAGVGFGTAAITAPAGTYALEIMHQYNSTGSWHTSGNLYYQNPVIVHILPVSHVDVDDLNANEGPFVYPNPATSQVNIIFNGTVVNSVRMMDIAGREVKQANIETGAGKMFFSVDDLSAGMYLVQLLTADGVITKKITIAK
jgi:hypothetical protein